MFSYPVGAKRFPSHDGFGFWRPFFGGIGCFTVEKHTPKFGELFIQGKIWWTISVKNIGSFGAFFVTLPGAFFFASFSE